MRVAFAGGIISKFDAALQPPPSAWTLCWIAFNRMSATMMRGSTSPPTARSSTSQSVLASRSFLAPPEARRMGFSTCVKKATKTHGKFR